MTSYNRSTQTYFTLKTIQNSSFKKIHIILVDDSEEDPIIKEELYKYSFYIDFIEIKRENKEWINPVVNYNIGFQYIKGSKVIIQNAEVCHIGDILKYMATEISDNNYYICNVRETKSFCSNRIIYQSNTDTIDIYNLRNVYRKWYQGINRMSNLHFLVGITINTFNYDYTFGFSYDDNDFLLKIISKKINIINLFHNEYYFGGIHLFHLPSHLKLVNIKWNNDLYFKKNELFLKSGEYIDITENIELFYEKYYIILNNNADTICK